MNDSTIESVLKSVNIIDIVSSYIPLKKSGSNYKARCPFHEERTASFNVSESKQIYKCFGCGKAGNAITFVRDYEKISFFEALKKIADRVGISVNDEAQLKKRNTRRDLIYTVYELANEFFMNNFKQHGDKAKRYLEKRQIPIEIAEKFAIGYALDSFNGLKSYLTRNHISKDIFNETGLFRTNENNDPYDLFRDRLMFPIHSINGKVVAYGGRSLDSDQEKQFKYINSPTTEIYTKGKELYGLHISRFDINKKGSVFISEGYLDFLRLYEKGFTNSVASLGTALTKEQVVLLSRYTQNFILLYDGDEAGIRAAVKAATVIVQNGCNSKIVLLPDKLDPDSYLLHHSNDDFLSLVENSLSLTKFVANHIKLFQGQRQAIQMLLDISPEIEDHIIRELYIKDVADTFQVSEINLRKNVKKNNIYLEPENNRKSISYKYEEERKLLKFLLKNTNLIKKVASELEIDYFINDSLKKIYSYLIDTKNEDYLSNPAMMLERLELAHNGENEAITEDLSVLFFDEDFLDGVDDLIRQVKLRKLKEDLKIVNDEIAKDTENSLLLERKFFIKKEIVKLSKNVVRKTFLE